jgi:hypothetical protein
VEWFEAVGKQRSQGDDPLQPEERRRVDLNHAKPAQSDIGGDPERNEGENEAEKNRLPDEVADVLEDPLRAGHLLLFARIEIQVLSAVSPSPVR